MKKFLISAIIALCSAFTAQGFVWKNESILSQGSWHKVAVEQTGLQFISRNQLSKIGLTPETAYIYGYGGSAISESEPASAPDDLPPVACVRTLEGIYFFGVGTVDIVSGNERTRNPYSTVGYYFLSDRKPEGTELKLERRIPEKGVKAIDSFTQRILHEKELAMAANTGRLVLGEDFRANNSQNFNLSLPGKISKEVDIAVKFATRTTNGLSSLFVSANGQRLPSTTSDNIAPVTTSERFIRTQLTEKKADVEGKDITVGIQYIPGGAVFTARLDYIIASYLRQLLLDSEPLLFELEAEAPAAKIEGFSNAHLWDITDPTSPIEIEGEIEGETMTFAHPKGQKRRYIAWKEGMKLPESPIVTNGNNQNLHAMSVPDMLIIAPEQFREAAEKVAALHQDKDGLEVAILTPTEIYNEFSSGTPDVNAYRRLMMMWRQRGGDKFRWCLLMGKPTNNPRKIGKIDNGIEPVLIWQSENEESQTTSFSTDDLIAMLDDTGTGFDMASAKLDIAVGRMPVSTPEEALKAAIKLERYVNNSDFGSWRNSALVIADDQDKGVHLEQAESIVRNLQAEGNGSDFNISKLYLDSYPLRLTPTGSAYPEAKEKMLKTWQNGVLLIDYIGHANTKSWGHEGLLNWVDIAGLKTDCPPFVYAATCDFGRWDDDADLSGAELMWALPDGGAIGVITASRVVYINSNGVLNNATMRRMLTKDHSGKGRTIGEIYRDGKNGQTGSDTNKLRYLLMGDPAMRLLRPELHVEIDSIAGISVPEAAVTGDLPMLKAGSRVAVTGRILTSEGTLASDFNGFIEPSLFDAEIPVETLGNGADGRKMLYNDRNERISTSRASVRDGLWKAELLLPVDISGNYSPALLTAYAASTDGQDAAGATENLYVYGWEENPGEDLEGPSIQNLWIGSEAFSSGDIIAEGAVLHADISDESGIYLGTGSIGNSMTIEIDGGDMILTDAALFCTPVADDPSSVVLSYPLPELQPGNHSLTLKVWDNNKNSSVASVDFGISARGIKSGIVVRPDHNPATTGVEFIVSGTGVDNIKLISISIYDLQGHMLWQSEKVEQGISWDLKDHGLNRVERGIYIYRVEYIDGEGHRRASSGRLAVTGQ